MKKRLMTKISVYKPLLLLLFLLSHIITNAETVGFNQLQESQVGQHKKSMIPGSPWLSSRLLVPHLTVNDVVESKRFYSDAFGFKVRFEDKPGKESQHVEMSHKDELIIMFVPKNVRGSGTVAPSSYVDPMQLTSYFYLYVDSVDEAYENALKSGGVGITAPNDSAWGDRFAIVADPNGYHWGLAESKNLVFQ